MAEEQMNAKTDKSKVKGKNELTEEVLVSQNLSLFVVE